MDGLGSKLSVADKPQFTETSHEFRSETKIGSWNFGTVLKELWNKTEVFMEKTKISSSELQSERKTVSRGFETDVERSSNATEAFTEISPSEVKLEWEIGSGGFGKVYKGSWNKTKVAIKVFQLEGSTKPRQAAIRKEAETWAKLHHPHVLHFLGGDVKGEIPFFVMPYLENGNARDLIERYPECNRNKILYDVTLALVYLHGRNVVHGDIKGFNVLIDSAHNAVLCDFGIALIKDDVLSKSLGCGEGSIVGTPSFMAPERLKGGSLRRPCDVYSFGMLIYEVHANANPLNLHIGYSEFMKMVTIEGHRPERPDRDEAPQLTDDVWRLAECCWEGAPSARPSIDNVCDMIAPSVKLYDNCTAHTVPRSGCPKRPCGDEAPHLTDDIGHLAEYDEDVCDSIDPTVRCVGRSSTHVPKPRATPTPSRSVLGIDHRSGKGGDPVLRRDPRGTSHYSYASASPSLPPSAYDRLHAGATFREAFVICTPCKYLWAITMTYDGKSIASSGGDKDDGTIHTWDSPSGARRRTLQGHTNGVTCLAFFKNGSLVSGSWDTTVRVWDLTSSSMVILEHDGAIQCISLSTDNKTIAAVSDGSVRLWDAITRNVMHTLAIPECTDIQSISISSDASFLVALGYSVYQTDWSLVAASWKRQPDGRWVIDVCRKCAVEEKHRPFFTSCSSSVPRFALSHNNDHLVIYGLHENENETQVGEGGRAVRFSPDGNWLVGTADDLTGRRTLKIWDAGSGKMLSELFLSTPKSYVNEVFISHDGSTIIAGDGPFLRVLVLTGK